LSGVTTVAILLSPPPPARTQMEIANMSDGRSWNVPRLVVSVLDGALHLSSRAGMMTPGAPPMAEPGGQGLPQLQLCDVFEVLGLITNFVRVAQRQAQQAAVPLFERDDGSLRVSTTRPSATMFILPMVSRMTAKTSCPT